MFARFSRVVVFFAAVQILGGHWMALQSAAWIGMIASNANAETLVVAIEKTFDGEHPCGLCEVVKNGRNQEEKQPLAKAIVKLDAVLMAAMVLRPPRGSNWKYPVLAPMAIGRTPAPLTPPPQPA